MILSHTVYAGFFDNPVFIVIALLAVFGVIVIAVMLIRKYSKHFRSDEKPKSAEEIAKEEVERVLEDVEDEKTKAEMEELAKSIEKNADKDKPTREEAAEEEVERATAPVLDEATRKAMEEYAKAHPEEALAAAEEESESQQKDE